MLKRQDCIALEFEVGERDLQVAGEAVSKIKKTLRGMDLDEEITRKTMIIIYEAIMNVVIHARFGTVKVFITPQQIMVVAEDVGKGITDVDLAMQEGYTTARKEIKEMGFGGGMGLPNIRRCADGLTVRSRIKKGVELRALIYITRKKKGIKRWWTDDFNGSCSTPGLKNLSRSDVQWRSNWWLLF